MAMRKKTIFSKTLKKQTMAEQMAETIQALILDGSLTAGTVLPTEPKLAEQFAVSRAVVRDATRILMARGLVEVRHGKGVFVTEVDNEAFGEALLLALSRTGASAWDVEEFEQILFPELIALAAERATAEDLKDLREMVTEYHEFLIEQYRLETEKPPTGIMNPTVEGSMRSEYAVILRRIAELSGNALIRQLSGPILGLRNLRAWADADRVSPTEAAEREVGYLWRLIQLIETRNPENARRRVRELMALPEEAVTAMKTTPVGEITHIPVPLPTLNEGKEFE